MPILVCSEKCLAKAKPTNTEQGTAKRQPVRRPAPYKKLFLPSPLDTCFWCGGTESTRPTALAKAEPHSPALSSPGVREPKNQTRPASPAFAAPTVACWERKCLDHVVRSARRPGKHGSFPQEVSGRLERGGLDGSIKRRRDKKEREICEAGSEWVDAAC